MLGYHNEIKLNMNLNISDQGNIVCATKEPDVLARFIRKLKKVCVLDLLTVPVGSVPVQPGSVPEANWFPPSGSGGRIGSTDSVRPRNRTERLTRFGIS